MTEESGTVSTPATLSSRPDAGVASREATFAGSTLASSGFVDGAVWGERTRPAVLGELLGVSAGASVVTRSVDFFGTGSLNVLETGFGSSGTVRGVSETALGFSVGSPATGGALA